MELTTGTSFETSGAKLKVIGIGGGGVSTVKAVIQDGIRGVEFIGCDLYVDDDTADMIPISFADITGKDYHEGTGGDINIGIEACEQSRAKIKESLRGTDMLFITSCFGGGTGTGATRIVADIARELDILTVALITKPFIFQGNKCMNRAMEGIEAIDGIVDVSMIIDSENLWNLPDKNITLTNAFKEANNMLKMGITTMIDIILTTGFINLDFQDVYNLMKNGGRAIFGSGAATGSDKYIDAVKKALSYQLLDHSMVGANSILLNIKGHEDELGLADCANVVRYIKEQTGNPDPDKVNVLYGVCYDNTYTDRASISLVATNFLDDRIIAPNLESDTVDVFQSQVKSDNLLDNTKNNIQSEKEKSISYTRSINLLPLDDDLN